MIFVDSMNCSTPGFPALHYLLEFAQIHVHWVGDAIQMFQPLLPLSPPILNLSHIRVFLNESVLYIRWPRYRIFSFSSSPSNEFSGLIFFRIDWFDLGVQGTLKSRFQYHNRDWLPWGVTPRPSYCYQWVLWPGLSVDLTLKFPYV